MSAPLTDIHLKNIIELGFKTIRSNPEHHLKDIFGENTLQPHAALYGPRIVEQVTQWIKTTQIPVILGFDLVDAQMPAVTVHLAGSVPASPVIGDEGLLEEEDLRAQEIEVLVKRFQPAGLDTSDPSSYILTLPDSMPLEQRELFLPGLKIRDAKGREYLISLDDNGAIRIIQDKDTSPLAQIDTSAFEVVSPVITARFSRGNMLYEERATIVIHGNSSRPEGLWLYYIVMWTLLKFRPVLTGIFSLDLSFPQASDYSKDDSFLGENVWRRYIQITAKTVWSWEMARQRDVLGLLLSVQDGRSGK